MKTLMQDPDHAVHVLFCYYQWRGYQDMVPVSFTCAPLTRIKDQSFFEGDLSQAAGNFQMAGKRRFQYRVIYQLYAGQQAHPSYITNKRVLLQRLQTIEQVV